MNRFLKLSIYNQKKWLPSDTGETISWQGHVPFAFTLIQLLKPACIVELGAYKGDSYLTFCEAVTRCSYKTRCFAVDTWRGDKHTGYYGEDVLRQLRAKHDQRYSSFSTLIHSTFDNALEQFPDGSVDLLHIDGLHSYEAVRHDFETWVSKLSSRGIVLFHDTAIRQAGFGVWKYWSELCEKYPHFEFHHSNGLGVLAVGKDAVVLLPDLFNINESTAEQIRTLYSTLGNSIAFQGLYKSLKLQQDVSTAELEKFGIWRQTQNNTIVGHDNVFAELNQSVSDLKDQIKLLSGKMERRGKWALSLQEELKQAEEQILKITSSPSWRMTLPLREAWQWLAHPSRQAKRYLGNMAKFAKALYLRLPLSQPTRATHRYFLMKRLPWLLRIIKGQSVIMQVPAVGVLQRPTEGPGLEAKSIKLKTSLHPIVSVIIPIYGKCEYTLRCLDSIAANPPSMPFEVIVVDDCSPDNSEEILKGVRGIRLVSNTQNQGFIRSCNIGARAAAGRYLCFLNNDTTVTDGWLQELVRTFREFPGTGLVGSKLVYPDGTLQEAGGIIWQDGSAWNFGRGQDPLIPVFNYAREVDYCSGASLMIPKELFEELGGFDEYYLPAYCEDSDIALKIRDRGYRVIYQPLSVVVHYEGVTSGRDTNQGAKAYQVENLRKQFQRWKERLASHQPPGIDVDNAKDRMSKQRVLVLDHNTPTPDQDTGSVVTFNLLLLLREMGFQVTFIPEDNFLYMLNYTSALQRAGIEVLYAPFYKSVEQHLKKSGARYDLAVLFRPGVVERHLKTIRKYCPKAKVLFHTVDLHYIRMSREADMLGDAEKQAAADTMKQRELAAIREVDAPIVISPAELELLKGELHDKRIYVFPLMMGIRGTKKAFRERQNIVFVGAYQHPPNVDAVQYLVREIMPILRQRIPDVCLYIVGSNPPPEILALAVEDVIISGFVEDLNSLLDQMRVSVAPLRYGAGIKGKIGAAMAVGLPTVATTLAAEGMSLTDEENILIADGADAFANAVEKLYKDEFLWEKLSNNGLEFAKNAWGPEASWIALERILLDLGITTRRRRYLLRLFSPGSGVIPSLVAPVSLQVKKLSPIGTCRTREGFQRLLLTANFNEIAAMEEKLIEQAKDRESFTVEGFCAVCNKTVPFIVDKLFGSQQKNGHWIPNWRERVECPICHMNNRQRLVAMVISQYLRMRGDSEVNMYFMESVTPIYNWAKGAFARHQVMGSEYLGYAYDSGIVVNGIRNENIEQLSFADGSFDLIISNDVLEHVADPVRALKETYRVLSPRGELLMTVPFHLDKEKSKCRAKLVDGKPEHVLPPVYHGNPLSDNGSLVFTDFGWEFLQQILDAGFAKAELRFYWSAAYGHFGLFQHYIHATKNSASMTNDAMELYLSQL